MPQIIPGSSRPQYHIESHVSHIFLECHGEKQNFGFAAIALLAPRFLIQHSISYVAAGNQAWTPRYEVLRNSFIIQLGSCVMPPSCLLELQRGDELQLKLRMCISQFRLTDYADSSEGNQSLLFQLKCIDCDRYV